MANLIAARYSITATGLVAVSADPLAPSAPGLPKFWTVTLDTFGRPLVSRTRPGVDSVWLFAYLANADAFASQPLQAFNIGDTGLPYFDLGPTVSGWMGVVKVVEDKVIRAPGIYGNVRLGLSPVIYSE